MKLGLLAWIQRHLWALRALSLVGLALVSAGCSSNGDAPDEASNSQRGELTTPVIQINSGGSAVSPFVADQGFTGGSTAAGHDVTTTGVANAAPADVYRTERYGNFTYVIKNLTPGGSYTARLHFAEIYWTATGKRRFNVIINGTQVLTNLDIFAQVGANKALVYDFATTANSSGQINVQYVTVVDNAKSSGIEILSGSSTPTNQPPSIATAAAASPSNVSGTTTSLSVLGSDDGGESSLTYSWATSGNPPAAVSFSANNSNAAKNTTATFTRAGSYSFVVTATDKGGLTATSSVTAQVSQTATSIAVSPGMTSVSTGAQQSFSASASDQFGVSLAQQPAFTWAVSGGGSIDQSGVFTAGANAGGPFTVTASSGGASGTASVTVVAATPVPDPPPSTATYRINSGGGAVDPFAADQYASGGTTFEGGYPVSTSGVTNAAPAQVYQSERYGNFSYTLPNLTPNADYTVRLHFAETYFTSSGKRSFDVLVNGTRVLHALDIVAVAGANKALVYDFATKASSSGQISIQYVSLVDNAKSSAIEILAAGSTPPPPGNQAPTIATAPAASPSTVTGTTSNLSVLGADDGGEANLTYTWSVSGSAPGNVAFSSNGSNASKQTVATFSAAGSYTLSVTVADSGGLTTSGNVSVQVNQQLKTIQVSPPSVTVAASGTQQFSASGFDQFGASMATQPSMAWAVSGGGSISTSGLFTAGNSAGGPFTVTASASNVSGTASVSVSSASSISYTTNFDLTESPISEGGVWHHSGLDWTLVNTSGGLAYGTQSGSGGFDDSYAYLTGFPADQKAIGIIHLSSSIDRSTTHEVELLLRWGDAAHDAHGYECNLAYDGSYAEIVRWNGKFGDFTYVARGSAPGGVHEGDKLQAQIVGTNITVTLNGNVIVSGSDSTYSAGNPGMAFWRGSPSGAFAGDYGFTSYTASSVP